MDSEKEIKGLRLAFENLVEHISGSKPTEEFFNDYCKFLSHMDFHVVGIGSETDVCITSVKAKITLEDTTDNAPINKDNLGAPNA